MRVKPFRDMIRKSRERVGAAEIGKCIQLLQAQYDNASLGLCDGHPGAITAMHIIAQRLNLRWDGKVSPAPTEEPR